MYYKVDFYRVKGFKKKEAHRAPMGRGFSEAVLYANLSIQDYVERRVARMKRDKEEELCGLTCTLKKKWFSLEWNGMPFAAVTYRFAEAKLCDSSTAFDEWLLHVVRIHADNNNQV